MTDTGFHIVYCYGYCKILLYTAPRKNSRCVMNRKESNVFQVKLRLWSVSNDNEITKNEWVPKLVFHCTYTHFLLYIHRFWLNCVQYTEKKALGGSRRCLDTIGFHRAWAPWISFSQASDIQNEYPLVSLSGCLLRMSQLFLAYVANRCSLLQLMGMEIFLLQVYFFVSVYKLDQIWFRLKVVSIKKYRQFHPLMKRLCSNNFLWQKLQS